MVLTREKCSICFNYWRAHGDNQADYQLLVRDQHIPAAHANHGTHTSSGPSVAGLQSQLNNANSRANGLQSQLDAANSRNNTLQTQVNNANTQIGGLRTQLDAANSRANDLQRQLDECRRENTNLKSQIVQLNTDKANLGTAIRTQFEAMKKKDEETLKYKTDFMVAETKIQTKLEPYILRLENILNGRGIPLPLRP
ncbi:hypothetical protein QQ045_019578 [Rhodiola kirilowii]